MIGVFGGSGFYSLLEQAEIKAMETPYGKPSSEVTVGKIGDRDIAFIARHGTKHQYPPHKIPSKANLWAFKELGVNRIIAPAAVGSLKAEVKPGEFLVPDQLVNFTRREETFYDGPETTHISFAEPFCPELREILIQSANELKLPLHKKGTVVVVQGPRFSSKAESEFFRNQGWDTINMTLYPECVLARELEMCYASILIITDYDTGLKDDPTIAPVTIEEIVRVFNQNNERVKNLIFKMVPLISEERKCSCGKALEGARF